MPGIVDHRNWFDYLVAITPVLITLFVAWVAHQQWKTNREKLRLDLYNRRFEIYVKTINFYQNLVEFDKSKEVGQLSRSHKEFIIAKQESIFLFDKNSTVLDLLESINSAAFKIIGFKQHGSDLERASPEEYMKMMIGMQDAYSHINDHINKLDAAISPYLNFHKVL